MIRGGFINRTKCPKCGGNIYLDNDQYGWYEKCLQCGYSTELKKVTAVSAHDIDRQASGLIKK